MPFKETNSLPTSPLVTVFFRGLLLINPNAAGTSCEIGVHRRAADHYPTIAIVGRKRNGDEFVIEFISGPPRGRSFSISAQPPKGHAPAAGEVSAYLPALEYPEPFDREHGKNDDKDFRWAVDLEGPEFHDGQLGADEAGTLPGIVMSHGVFYTALLTDKREITVTRRGGGVGKPEKDLQRIAQFVGAHIVPPEGHTLLVEWEDRGVAKSMSLPRPEDEGATYQIYVRNDPPGFIQETSHDELELYYDVIRQGGSAIGVGDRFSLKAEPVRKEPLLTTDRIPCMPVVLGL